MRNPTLLAQTIRTILQSSGYVSLPVTQQNLMWMIQQIGALPDEYNFVMQQMQLERQQFLAEAIAQTLQNFGYSYLPAIPQNVTWMMQQVGAIAEEADFISQQLQRHQSAATVPQQTDQMKRSPTPLTFGQRDPIELVVNPRRSFRETTYFFSASGFDPQVQVQVQAKITDARKRTIYRFASTTTDRNGYTDSAALKWVPPVGTPVGQYLFVASGRCRGREMTRQIAFEVE